MPKKEDYKIEPANESEVETSEEEIYVPKEENPELVVEESAYRILEYISMEWPSQTIELLNENMIMLATNPANDDPNLVRLDFEKTDDYNDVDNFYFEKIQVKYSFNRIRQFKNNLFCVSDESLCIFDKNYKFVKEYKGNYGYGLTHMSEKVCSTLKNGNIKLIDYNRNKTEERKIHENTIESLDFHENLLFSASTDKSMKITDLRTKENVLTRENDCDINAISYNKNNFVIFGDDKGVLRLMDIRNNNVEEIIWHKTPISMVKFRNEDEFVSASDEQVVLWDKSFEEEWEYHKYISFVHQGQKYYKDVCFNDNEVYFTTSYEGVCIFSPINE